MTWLVECLSDMQEALASIPISYKPETVVHIFNLSTQRWTQEEKKFKPIIGDSKFKGSLLYQDLNPAPFIKSGVIESGRLREI